MRRFLRAHRGSVLAAAVVLAGLVVFVLVWFQPQKIFIEQTVDEGLPRATSTEGEPPSEPAPSLDETAVLAEGTFQSLDHETTGAVRIIQLDSGERYLRFEDLATSNGPDLRVYLSEIPASDDSHAYGERFIDLGPLKGNRGDQNYEIPAGTDLSRYKSAVVWCRRFTVGFGIAGLS
ncbi:MAG: DM13 domain-containing protein [Actinomycetota bacterium]|nr:DM13 domain-containing protein [Actinomycetota bacterium]